MEYCMIDSCEEEVGEGLEFFCCPEHFDKWYKMEMMGSQFKIKTAARLDEFIRMLDKYWRCEWCMDPLAYEWNGVYKKYCSSECAAESQKLVSGKKRFIDTMKYRKKNKKWLR